MADYHLWGGHWIAQNMGLWRWAAHRVVALRGAGMLAWAMVWWPMALAWHGRTGIVRHDEWDRWQHRRKARLKLTFLLLSGMTLLFWPTVLVPGAIPAWALMGGLILFP